MLWRPEVYLTDSANRERREPPSGPNAGPNPELESYLVDVLAGRVATGFGPAWDRLRRVRELIRLDLLYGDLTEAELESTCVSAAQDLIREGFRL